MNRPDHLVLADWARVANGHWVAYSLLITALLVSAGVFIQDLPPPLLPTTGETAPWPPTALRNPGAVALFVLARSILYLSATLGVAAVFAIFVPRPIPNLRAAFGRALVPWALAQPGFGVRVLVVSGVAACLSALGGLPQVASLHGLVTGTMVRLALALLTIVLAVSLFVRLHTLIVQSSWAATGKRRGVIIAAAWCTVLGVSLIVGSLVEAGMGMLPGTPR